MVMWWAVSQALAAPVICDEPEATRIVTEARLPLNRVPVIQPQLVPGIAQAHSAPAVASAIRSLCDASESMSVARADTWRGANWRTDTLIVTGTTLEGCTLVSRALAITGSAAGDDAPTYRIRERLPEAITPIGDCDAAPTWQEETVIAGEDGPVRLILRSQHAGDARTGAQLVVRRASAQGWQDQVLRDPAPPRLIDPTADGPTVFLERVDDSWWVVESHDRVTTEGQCTAAPGQTIWRWSGDRWSPVEGRTGLLVLFQAGLWRLAGEEAWVTVVGQDDPTDAALLPQRQRRIQRRSTEQLYVLESAHSAELNPGFLIIAPAPFQSEADARAVKRDFRRRSTTYVKRAWPAPDPCASTDSP